jgi:hypothetical protein
MRKLPEKGTHAHRILSHIQRYGKLPLPTLLGWFMPSYTARISELRKNGWPVECTKAYVKKNGKTVCIVEYILSK